MRRNKHLFIRLKFIIYVQCESGIEIVKFELQLNPEYIAK